MSTPEWPAQDTTPKPFVFVLMPFDKKFNDIYKFGIKEAAQDIGAYAERLDEQMFTEGMLDRIYSQIGKADVIVADMTGRNPNVFYEVGYAHALNKIVIPLTQKAEDIPFDLQHRQHIVYGESIETLRSDLVKYLAWAIPESQRRAQGKRDERFLVTVGWNHIPKHTAHGTSPSIRVKVGNMEVAWLMPVVVTNASQETAGPITHIYLLTTKDPQIVPCRPTDVIEGDIQAVARLSPMNLPDDPTAGEFVTRYRLGASIGALPPQAVEDFATYLTFRLARQPVQQKFRLRLHSATQYFDYDFTLDVGFY